MILVSQLLHLIPTILVLGSSMQSAAEDAKSFGKTAQSKALSHTRSFQPQELVSEENRRKTFDPDNARNNVQSRANTADETTNYLQSNAVQKNKQVLNDDEYFLEKSENISSNPNSLEIEQASEQTIHTCQQTDAPYPLSITRELQVDIEYNPGITREVHVCKGHWKEEKFSKLESAKNTAEKWRKEFASDPTVASYQVNVHANGMFHKHIVKAVWTHHNDVNNCNFYQTLKEEITEPTWQETNEHWEYDEQTPQGIINGPYCTFIEKTCLDSTPSKTINGKEVQRQCWKERLTFFCQLPNAEECPFIKDSNCELINKKCLNEGPYGCTLWELTFRCYSKFFTKKVGEGEPYGMDDEPEYEPNDSFSEVAAKLAVFEAIKEDLEESEAVDASKVQVFKGQSMECGKNVVDDLLYDCCFSYSGLAKELGLKTCSAEEITLAEMREQGLCHYVGSYDEKFAGLWKSRDQHVFCCFGTKLARVLQENARDQLYLGWNDPKHVDCRGLTLDEISRLNFSEMDFSELYEGYERKLPENFQDKLNSFADNMEQKVEEANEKK